MVSPFQYQVLTQSYNGKEISSCKKTTSFGLIRFDDLCWRLTEQEFQRAGQMRLIEISHLICSLRDGYPALKKRQCLPCSFDLLNGFVCETRNMQEAALDRTQ